VAAHELKTPVTAIKGFAQSLLRNPTAVEPKHRHALETIVRQSGRIEALTRDFLEISRMQQRQKKLSRHRVDLTALVSRIAARTTLSTAKHRILISQSDPTWVDGESDRLEEVVMNLLENALRYSPGGGDVEIRVVHGGDKAIVSVTDHGVGISGSRQVNVFERFYRAHIGTSQDYGGLGVGLYISRELIRPVNTDRPINPSPPTSNTSINKKLNSDVWRM
jgi:two-component system, OmpR family, phosphate regulon sensor histidine kinase PhoR